LDHPLAQPDEALILHRETIAPLVVPPGWMFAGGSRLSNIYQPDIERIFLPAECVPEQDIAILQHSADTADILELCRKDHRLGKRVRLRHAVEVLRGGRAVTLGGRLAYDARWVDNSNLAHLLQHHVAILGYLAARLGIGAGDCLVILDKPGETLASRLFTLLGYETFATLRSIRGQTLSVRHDPDIPYSLLPFAARVMPALVGDSPLPGKVFIPRRGLRRLGNQAEVEPMLRERGIATIYLEDLALQDQFRLFRDAKQIVAIHGAGLGHLSIRPPTAPPVDLREIFSPGLVTDVFRKYIAALGGHWTGCRGNLTSEFVRLTTEVRQPKAAANKDFAVDPRALQAALDPPPFPA
jgi:hypothetical protein